MSAETTVEIRRYPNRRFYDRSRRRYVTLQDIESLVLRGTDVEVRDSRTGEDITRQVLTQILMERHPQKMDLFPVGMLHNILRANAMALDLWRGTMTQALAAMENLQKAAAPFGTPLGWMSAFFPGMAPTATPRAPGAATEPEPEPEPVSAPDDAEGEITARVEELLERVERLEAAAGRRPGPDATGPPLDRLEERLDRLETGSAPEAKAAPRTRRRARGGAA